MKVNEAISALSLLGPSIQQINLFSLFDPFRFLCLSDWIQTADYRLESLV